MHGLIFKTSISLLAGSTRYLNNALHLIAEIVQFANAQAQRPMRSSISRVSFRSSTGDRIRHNPCVRHGRTAPDQRESARRCSPRVSDKSQSAPADFSCRPRPGPVTAALLCCRILNMVSRGRNSVSQCAGRPPASDGAADRSRLAAPHTSSRTSRSCYLSIRLRGWEWHFPTWAANNAVFQHIDGQKVVWHQQCQICQ